MRHSSFDFIKALEPNALAFLEEHLKPISIPKDTLLFYQGDVCENILWLQSGQVRLYTNSSTISVEEMTLYTLNPGEQCIVNTASLFSQSCAIASAQTITNVEGWIISAKRVKELVKISNVYQNYLFSLYHLRFENLTSLISDIKFKRLDERILEWLRRKNIAIIKITHERIATDLGTSRVVISRTLKELENQKHIKLRRGRIEVL